MFGHDKDDDKNQDTSQGSNGYVAPPPSAPPVTDSLEPPTAAPGGTPLPTPLTDDGAGETSPTVTTSPALPAASDSPASSGSPAVSDDLLNIKQQALQQLSPLVDHLDQTPEEKFRTTMMMIQAADNQSLIDTAYKAAQQITDEKARAQALLDIVNEINYFTQQAKS